MSFLISQSLLNKNKTTTYFLTQIRNANRTLRKPNLRKPKEPDFNKKLLLSIVEPHYIKAKIPDVEICKEWHKNKKTEIHPYIEILAKEFYNEISSNYVYLVHLNSIKNYMFWELRKEFLRKNMDLKKYNQEVIITALTNTKFSNLIPLLINHGTIAFSDELKLKEVQDICKNNQYIVLLGGIFDNQIMSLQQINNYSKLGNIDQVRAQLCQTLSSQQQQLLSTLNYHTTELTYNLKNCKNNE